MLIDGRPVLVGLLARTAPLPRHHAEGDAHARQAIEYVFAADYDLTSQNGVHDLTPCPTLLGRLVDRLLPIDSRHAARVLLDILDRLNELHPGPAHWRQTLAIKWRCTVMALAETLPATERRNRAERLLDRDPYLVADAVVACVTRDQVVAPWILDLTENLPDGARGRLRSTIFETARERSHRRFLVAATP